MTRETGGVSRSHQKRPPQGVSTENPPLLKFFRRVRASRKAPAAAAFFPPAP
jgi:hypothetical protein